MVTFRYPDGAWKICVSAVLEDASLQLENLFECEMLFPRTKFRLSRSTIYSPSKLNISNSLREVKYTFSLSRTTISLGEIKYLFKIIHQCNWRLHFDNDDLSETQCVTSTDIYQGTISCDPLYMILPYLFIFSYNNCRFNCRGGIPHIVLLLL